MINSIRLIAFLVGLLLSNFLFAQQSKLDSIYMEYVNASIFIPSSYKYIPEISSFTSKENHTSVSVVEYELSPSKMYDNILETNYEGQNFSLVTHEKINDGYQVTFDMVIKEQDAQRVCFIKGNEMKSIMACGNYKKAESEKYREKLLTVIYSVKRVNELE